MAQGQLDAVDRDKGRLQDSLEQVEKDRQLIQAQLEELQKERAVQEQLSFRATQEQSSNQHQVEDLQRRL